MKCNIKGKEVKFSYGLYFLGKAQKITNNTLYGMLQGIQENPLCDVVDLMYLSMKVECDLDDLKVPFTKREFIQYMEVEEYGKEDGIIYKWTSKLIESISGHFLPKNEDEGNENQEEEKKK